MQFALDTELALKAEADEVSILFKHPTELDGFVQWCRRIGVDHFNTVSADRCFKGGSEHVSESGQPNLVSFDVRFEFLRIPGVQWRIEAMCVLGGQADIHAPLKNHDIPHVSFKCIDPMHYDHVLAVLRGRRWPQQASYVNSYGAFSYFGAYAPYLKPRVNLRDRDSAIV